MRLKNKVAIITGAADLEGIGAALALRFVKEGAKVVLADIVDGSVVVERLIRAGGEALFVKTDVTRQEDCDAMAKASADRFSRIDILVNNAAVYANLIEKHFFEVTTEEWNTVMAVNSGGPFHCIKAVFPYMKDKGGKIINTVSDIFFHGFEGLPHYVASKGAVFALTRAMARELGPYQINVNSLAPGYTKSRASLIIEKNSQITPQDEDIDGVIAEMRCIKRAEYPEDLSGAAVFLSSSDSDFITGQMILVNGGMCFN